MSDPTYPYKPIGDTSPNMTSIHESLLIPGQAFMAVYLNHL